MARKRSFPFYPIALMDWLMEKPGERFLVTRGSPHGAPHEVPGTCGKNGFETRSEGIFARP